MDGSVTIGRKGTGLRPFVQVFGPQVMDARISDGAYRTLHMLDLLEGADREGTHSLALIARMRKVEERTVRRHLREIEEAKIIDVEATPGKTNRITILEPLDIYGRKAIGNFYFDVQQANKELRLERANSTIQSATPDKNVRPPRTKLSGVPRTKMSPHPPQKTDATLSDDKDLRDSEISGTEYRGAEDIEQSPKGAASPPAIPQLSLPCSTGQENRVEQEIREKYENGENPKIGFKAAGMPQDGMEVSGCMTAQGRPASPQPQPSLPAPSPCSEKVSTLPHQEGEKPPQTICAPFRSTRSGCRILVPGEDEEDVVSKKKKNKALYDAAKNPEEWNAPNALGYFVKRYREMWPGEGAPDFKEKRDLPGIKGRIAWLRAEGIGADMMKKAIDHLFASWGDGLPSRLKWDGTRPGLVLISTIRWFEFLVREVQGGVATSGRLDEFKDKTPEDRAMFEKYKEKDAICAQLMDGGMTAWEAEREAKKRVGLA